MWVGSSSGQWSWDACEDSDLLGESEGARLVFAILKVQFSVINCTQNIVQSSLLFIKIITSETHQVTTPGSPYFLSLWGSFVMF